MGEAAFYRVKTLAERWACSKGKILRMVHEGKIPAIRFDDTIRIPIAAIEEVEKRAACQPKPNPVSAASRVETCGTSITSAGASLRAARIAHRLS